MSALTPNDGLVNEIEVSYGSPVSPMLLQELLKLEQLVETASAGDSSSSSTGEASSGSSVVPSAATTDADQDERGSTGHTSGRHRAETQTRRTFFDKAIEWVYTQLGAQGPLGLPQIAQFLASEGHYGALVRVIAVSGGAATLLSLLPTKLRLSSHQVALLAYTCGGQALLRRKPDLTQCFNDWNRAGESDRTTIACLALALTFGLRTVCVMRYRPANTCCPVHGPVSDAVLHTFWTEIDHLETVHEQLEAQWRALVHSTGDVPVPFLACSAPASLASPTGQGKPDPAKSACPSARCGQRALPGSTSASSLTADMITFSASAVDGRKMQPAYPALSNAKTSRMSYVVTASRQKALEQLRAAVAYGAPVLLQGEPACGKRALFHYLAAEMQRPTTTFYWDRLGFEEDAFLDAVAVMAPSGPGCFQWRLGPLGEALVQGHWLLLEGLGAGPQTNRRLATSVIRQLADLRPGDSFELPGRGLSLPLERNFRLFAIRSVDSLETETALTAWHSWVVVSLAPYSGVERRQILVERFPASLGWVDRILATVDACAACYQEHHRRHHAPGLAEAVRLAARLHRVQQAQGAAIGQELALLHAMDVLLEHEPSMKEAVLRQLAAQWSVSEREAMALARQACTWPSMGKIVEQMAVAPTQPTCMALRQLHFALEQEEPVLLIGEAGVGKTYLVQELARCLGRHLVVLNMSQQSDLAELLGGYQPVNAQKLLVDLARQIELAFRATFSSRQNVAFIQHLRLTARRRDAGRLVRLARGLLARVGTSTRLHEGNVTHWEQVQRLARQTEDAYGASTISHRGKALDAFPSDTGPVQATGRGRKRPGTSATQQSIGMATMEGDQRPGTSATQQSIDVATMEGDQRPGTSATPQSMGVATIEGDQRPKTSATQQSIDVATMEGDQHVTRPRSDGLPTEISSKSGKDREPSLRFAFKEGLLAAAIRQGDLVLLDELNLAPPACLERLTGILDTLGRPPARSPAARLAAWQNNELAQLAGSGLIRHPDFRLVACMNPETDIGRRALPPALRKRFTIITLTDDLQENDLHQLAEHLFTKRIGSRRDKHAVDPTLTKRVVRFYQQARQLGSSELSTAGDGTAPRYPLRTLSRMLRLATCLTNQGLDARRALYEGACLGFATFLDEASRRRVLRLAREILCPELTDSQLKQPVTKLLPSWRTRESVIELGGQWLAVYPGQGGISSADTRHHSPGKRQEATAVTQNTPPQPEETLSSSAETWQASRALHPKESPISTARSTSFLCTPTMERALRDMARALVDGLCKTPVLIEGATAAGKTALVQYIAECTGHELIRLNQHEHTEVSEYLGGYTIGTAGDLVFVEGPLVRAARHGHWVLLDELNLAPGDVLESINRLLDENRELIIPETGQVVQAHPHFALFATQNPSGGRYAGRKTLSPAFRSRFVLIHLPEMSDEELIQILCTCHCLPERFAVAMVAVLRDLQLRRSIERIFAGAEGLVTARDLFRWARRQPRDRRALAFHGRCLLVERIRQAAEREAVWRILCRRLGFSERSLDPSAGGMDLSQTEGVPLSPRQPENADRLHTSLAVWDACPWVLDVLAHNQLHRAKDANVPATSIADQVWERVCSVAQEYGLVMVPALRRLLELALQCIMHQEAVLFVGETGIGKSTVCSVLATALGRELITINGHRHTEAADLVGRYVPAASSPPSFVWQDGALTKAMRQGAFLLLDEINMVDDAVIERLNSVLEPAGQLVLSERGGEPLEIVQAAPSFRVFACMNPSGDFGKKELSAAIRNRFTEIWVPFEGSWNDLWPIACHSLQLLSQEDATITQLWQRALAWRLHTCRDLLPAVSIRDLMGLIRVYRAAIRIWHQQPAMALAQGIEACWMASQRFFPSTAPSLERASFLTVLGLPPQTDLDTDLLSVMPSWTDRWCLTAPTARKHLARLFRVLYADQRPILLEGPPGVGKTHLVICLASSLAKRLHRVNLSESTEMIDLVGTFVPDQGGFQFQKGPLYQALEQGDWILVDELNLASQSVLEGLNAVLDHRRLLQVPELGICISAAEGFRFFGTQNPAGESVGRRPLPRSFLNRFWCLSFEPYGLEDYEQVLQSRFPALGSAACRFLSHWWPEQVQRTIDRRANLRDILRLATLWHAFPQTPVEDWASLLLPRRVMLSGQLQELNLSTAACSMQHEPVNEVSSFPAGGLENVARLPVQPLPLPCWQQRASFRGPVPTIIQLSRASFGDGSVLETCGQDTGSTLRGSALRRVVAQIFHDQTNLAMVFSGNVSSSFSDHPEDHVPSQVHTETIGLQVGLHGTMPECLCPTMLSWGPLQLAWKDAQGPTAHGLLARAPGTPTWAEFRPQQAPTWAALAIGVTQRWPCLLIGPSQTGKASLVRAMAEVLGARLHEVLLSNQADMTDLLGGYRQATEGSASDDEVAANDLFHGYCQVTEGSAFEARGTSETGHRPAPARFVWHPSRLLQAIQQGHWLLLRRVEAMSAALLDRLNPLLEDGVTEFVVPEAPLQPQSPKAQKDGAVREPLAATTRITIHPSFRIFMTATTTTANSLQLTNVSQALQNRCLTLWMQEHPAEPCCSSNVCSCGSETSSSPRPAGEQMIVQNIERPFSASKTLSPESREATRKQRCSMEKTRCSRLVHKTTYWPALRFFFDPLSFSLEEDLTRLLSPKLWSFLDGSSHTDATLQMSESIRGDFDEGRSVGIQRMRPQQRQRAIAFLRRHREAAGLLLTLTSSLDLSARITLTDLAIEAPMVELLESLKITPLAACSSQPWLDQLQSVRHGVDRETALIRVLLIIYWRCFWPWNVPWTPPPLQELVPEVLIAQRLNALEHLAGRMAEKGNDKDDGTNRPKDKMVDRSQASSRLVRSVSWQWIRTIVLQRKWMTWPPLALPNTYTASASEKLQHLLLQDRQHRWVSRNDLEAAAEAICWLTKPSPLATERTSLEAKLKDAGPAPMDTGEASRVLADSSLARPGCSLAYSIDKSRIGEASRVLADSSLARPGCSLAYSIDKSRMNSVSRAPAWLTWFMLLEMTRLLRASCGQDTSTPPDREQEMVLASRWSRLFAWLIHFAWPLPLVAAVRQVVKSFDLCDPARSLCQTAALTQLTLYWHHLLWLLSCSSCNAFLNIPDENISSDCSTCSLFHAPGTVLSGWSALRCLGRVLAARQRAQHSPLECPLLMPTASSPQGLESAPTMELLDSLGLFVREMLWDSPTLPSGTPIDHWSELLAPRAPWALSTWISQNCSSADTDQASCLDPALVWTYLRDQALPWLCQLRARDQDVQCELVDNVFYRIPGSADAGLLQRVDLTEEQLDSLLTVSHWRAFYRSDDTLLAEGLGYLAAWQRQLVCFAQTQQPAWRWSSSERQQAQQFTQLAEAFLPAGRFHQVHDVVGLFLLQSYQEFYEGVLQPSIRLELEQSQNKTAIWSTLWRPWALQWSRIHADTRSTGYAPCAEPQEARLGDQYPGARPVLVQLWNALHSCSEMSDSRKFWCAWALVLDAALWGQAGPGVVGHGGDSPMLHPSVASAWQVLVEASWPEAFHPASTLNDSRDLFRVMLAQLGAWLSPLSTIPGTRDGHQDGDTDPSEHEAIRMVFGVSFGAPAANAFETWEEDLRATATATMRQEDWQYPISELAEAVTRTKDNHDAFSRQMDTIGEMQAEDAPISELAEAVIHTGDRHQLSLASSISPMVTKARSGSSLEATDSFQSGNIEGAFGTSCWQVLPALLASLFTEDPGPGHSAKLASRAAVALQLLLATMVKSMPAQPQYCLQRRKQEKDSNWIDRYRALLRTLVLVTSQLLEPEPVAVWHAAFCHQDAMPYFWTTWQLPSIRYCHPQPRSLPQEPLLHQLHQQVHEWAMQEHAAARWSPLDERWDECLSESRQRLYQGEAREALERILEQLLEPLADKLFHQCAFEDTTGSHETILASTWRRLGAVLSSYRLQCWERPSLRQTQRWYCYQRRVAQSFPVWVHWARMISGQVRADTASSGALSTEQSAREWSLSFWTACGRLFEQIPLGYAESLLQLWSLLAASDGCITDSSLAAAAPLFSVLESYYGRFRGPLRETREKTMARQHKAWQLQRTVLSCQLKQPWQSHHHWQRYRDIAQRGQQLERQQLRMLAQQLDRPIQMDLEEHRHQVRRQLMEHALFSDSSNVLIRMPQASQYLSGMVEALEAYDRGLASASASGSSMQYLERSLQEILQLLRQQGLRRGTFTEPLHLHWPQTALWLARAPWKRLRPADGAVLDGAICDLLDAFLVLDEQFWHELSSQPSSPGMRSVAMLFSTLLALLHDLAEQRVSWSYWMQTFQTKTMRPSRVLMSHQNWDLNEKNVDSSTRADKRDPDMSLAGIAPLNRNQELSIIKALVATRELTVLLSCWPGTERLQCSLEEHLEELQTPLADHKWTQVVSIASKLENRLRTAYLEELKLSELPQKELLERLLASVAELVGAMLTSLTVTPAQSRAESSYMLPESKHQLKVDPTNEWAHFYRVMEETPTGARRPLQDMLRWRPNALASVPTDLPGQLDSAQLEKITESLAGLHRALLVVAHLLLRITARFLTLQTRASATATPTETKTSTQLAEGFGLTNMGATDDQAIDSTAQVSAADLGEELASGSSISQQAYSESDTEAVDLPSDAFTGPSRLLPGDLTNQHDEDASEDGAWPWPHLSDRGSRAASESSLDLDDTQAEDGVPLMSSQLGWLDDQKPEAITEAMPTTSDDEDMNASNASNLPETASTDDLPGPGMDHFLPGDDREECSSPRESPMESDEDAQAGTLAFSSPEEDGEEHKSPDADSSMDPATGAAITSPETSMPTDATQPVFGETLTEQGTTSATEADLEQTLLSAGSAGPVLNGEHAAEASVARPEATTLAGSHADAAEQLGGAVDATDGVGAAFDLSAEATMSKVTSVRSGQDREMPDGLGMPKMMMTFTSSTAGMAQGQLDSDQSLEQPDHAAAEKEIPLSRALPESDGRQHEIQPRSSKQQDGALPSEPQQQQNEQAWAAAQTPASPIPALSTRQVVHSEALSRRERATEITVEASTDPNVIASSIMTVQHEEQWYWSLLESRHENTIAALSRRLEPILEYNQLTRFAGDFRTGKRLHMRRLIDYVASNYTRDRIWMRRVRPDRRQYDIVVAVDDSASMRESGAHRLALESLVVVAAALHRLELGQLGVVRFGADAQVVHHLTDGMPSAGVLGDQLIRQFTFQQEATNVEAMLQCALSVFREAREQQHHGGIDAWQLLLILSDGRLGNREAIRSLIREANAQQQWLVFFILDHSAEVLGSDSASKGATSTSVLDMKQVGFTETGRLQVRRYLEDFPFPFYVIVQKLEALPFVFGDALTQWLASSRAQH
jgi:MoxR-like ATPase